MRVCGGVPGRFSRHDPFSAKLAAGRHSGTTARRESAMQRKEEAEKWTGEGLSGDTTFC